MSREAARGRIVGFIAIGALAALVGVAYFTGRERPAPGAADAPDAAASRPAAGAAPAAPGADDVLPEAGSRDGVVTAVADTIVLNPRARLLAERFKCVCGCNDILSTCTCSKTPGSRDMKLYLQQLVDEDRSPAEIQSAMVERYGGDVLP